MEYGNRMMTAKRLVELIACLLVTILSVQADTVLSRGNIAWTISGTLTEGTDYGRYADGSWWVLTGNTVKAISPAPTSTRNGTVINPAPGQTQGFDDRLVNNPYSASLNIYNQLPRTQKIPASFVSSRSATTSPTWGKVQEIQVLTFVEAAPAHGSFRPPWLGTNKVSNWTTNHINWSKFNTLPPIGGEPSISSLTNDLFAGVWYEQNTQWSGRYLNQPYMASDGFGRKIGGKTFAAAALLNTDYPVVDKHLLAIGLIQYGLDIYALTESGARWFTGGGHGCGRMVPLVVAAMALDDAILKEAVAQPKFQSDQQVFFVSQADVDQWRYTADGRPRSPYSTADIGKPEWGEAHVNNPSRDGNNWDAYYRATGGTILVGDAAIIQVMGAVKVSGRPALQAYAQRAAYYQAGLLVTRDIGWDFGVDYGDIVDPTGGATGNNSGDPWGANKIPNYMFNFYLTHENVGMPNSGGGSNNDPLDNEAPSVPTGLLVSPSS